MADGGSKVTIELDAEVVRKAVNAKVQPAVNRILDEIDLSARIAAALNKKPSETDLHRRRFHPMFIMGDYGDSLTPIDR